MAASRFRISSLFESGWGDPLSFGVTDIITPARPPSSSFAAPMTLAASDRDATTTVDHALVASSLASFSPVMHVQAHTFTAAPAAHGDPAMPAATPALHVSPVSHTADLAMPAAPSAHVSFAPSAVHTAAPQPHGLLGALGAAGTSPIKVTYSPHATSDAGGGGGDPVGQLWVAFGGAGDGGGGNPDGFSDFRVEHVDSDGLADTYVIQQHAAHSAGAYFIIGLDTTANLSFTVDGSLNFRVTNLTTGVDLSSTVIASAADQDLFGTFVVDAKNNVIYADLFGYDYQTANPAPYGGTLHGAGIIKITYNPTTGAISSPYTFNDGAHTGSVNLNQELLNSGSTGHVYANARAMQLSADGNTLYYIDCNNNDPGGYWGFKTNGIYKVSTTGDVGHGTAPTPTLLSLQSDFPVNDSNGYLTGMEVDEAKGVIYFTTNSNQPNINTSQDAIWWMDITGGAAHKMTIPAGVSVKYPTFYGDSLTLDVASQQLYYADNQTGLISRFTLSADGHSFTDGATFATIDANGGYDLPGHDTSYSNYIVFDDLPVLGSLTATTTEAVQGGSAITLLTATPTMSDPDGFDLSGATVTITNAQTGDVLAANTAGTSITASYSTSTHKLTLSGEDTYAHYQQAFNSITYQDTGVDNSVGSHPTRSLTWVILDGITVVHPSTADPNERTTTVVIDRAPTLTADSYAVLSGATVTGTSGTGGTGVLGNDNDKDGDAIALSQVNGSGGNVGNSVAGTYGHLTLNSNGSFSYIADNTSAIDNAATGSHPIDTFTYQVTDGLGGLTTSTVSFTIDRVPTVVSDNPATNAVEGGVALIGNTLTNDSDKDGDSLTVSAVNGSGGNVGNSLAGTYGHITIGSNGAYSYVADNTVAIDAAATGSHLTDTFTYTANDGHGGTATQTITVTVDRPPTVVSDAPGSQAVEGGSAVTGNTLSNDSDRDGDSLTVSAVLGVGGNVGNTTATTYGHVNIGSIGAYSYSADNTVAIDAAATGSHLTDTIAYTASDGHGGTTTTNLVVTLDRGPTIVNANFNIAEGAGGSANAGTGVLANDSDRDGDSLTITAVAGSGANVGNPIATNYGHVTLNADGSYSYLSDNTAAIDAAANGSHPVDTISFTVSDGHGGIGTETLSFTIDRLAVANADAISTNENAVAQNGVGGNVNILANDIDKDGDTIAVTEVNGSGANVGTPIALASGALLTVNSNGTYSYDPNHAFDYLPDAASGASNLTATDSFTYTIGSGSTVTVTVTIHGVDSDDTLLGTSGDDTLSAGIGDDTVNASQGGVDSVDGGSANDTLSSTLGS